MGNTFGGEHHRLGSNGRDPQRGHSREQLSRRASFDHEPQDDCLSSLFLLSICVTATVAALRGRK